MLKDEKLAEELLKPQADKGDAESQFALASLYQFGETFAARRDEAQVWLQRAADQGHPKALEILRGEGKVGTAGPVVRAIQAEGAARSRALPEKKTNPVPRTEPGW